MNITRRQALALTAGGAVFALTGFENHPCPGKCRGHGKGHHGNFGRQNA